MKYRPEELIAHSENAEGRVQPLVEHLENVAEMAAEFAAPFGSEDFARWIGWWHDAGKVADDIQDYLRGRGISQDHSSVGMLEAWKLENFPFLAFNIAGHHGGIANQVDLKRRVQEKENDHRIQSALQGARPLIEPEIPKITPANLPRFLREDKLTPHRLEFWIRMLHSTLVDADCLNTEGHFNSEKSQLRPVNIEMYELWKRYERSQKELMSGSDKELKPINQVRQKIYRSCLETAEGKKGCYSATIPTGGGKTRSLLGFALKHAEKNEMERIIIVLPFTSIIDQNARVYRKIFESEDDIRSLVLEHHSAVKASGEPGDESEEERWRRLASENWDAPIVVTTSVQFFESLFSNRNSRLRKLHNISNSVVILDEVQTLPPRLLNPTLDVLQELMDSYGSTVVLCTATQPAFQSRDGFSGLHEVKEIVPDPFQLYQQLQRVHYDVRLDDVMSWSEIAGIVEEHEQVMVVLNTIRDAEELLEELKGVNDVYHLSTKMCGAHRQDRLEEIKQRLKPGNPKPVRLITTQVVECGVDMDFPCVMRAIGPLDNIIQAAGRCNREGRATKGDVIVFKPADGRLPPGGYETGTHVTEQMLSSRNVNMHSHELPHRYFENLYPRLKLDKEDVQEIRARFQYEDVAARYKLIDAPSVSYVAPYEPKLDKIRRVVKRIHHRGNITREDWRALQPYIVTLYVWKHEEGEQLGLAEPITDDLYLWPEQFYNDHGIEWPGVLIV